MHVFNTHGSLLPLVSAAGRSAQPTTCTLSTTAGFSSGSGSICALPVPRPWPVKRALSERRSFLLGVPAGLVALILGASSSWCLENGFAMWTLLRRDLRRERVLPVGDSFVVPVDACDGERVGVDGLLEAIVWRVCGREG